MKMMKAIRWAAANGLMAALMWFGFGPEQVDGARYVYTFFQGFTVLITTFAAFSTDLKTELRSKGRPVHGLFCVAYDVACTGFLVWHGHWVLGMLIMWQVMCLAAIYADPKAVKEQAA